MAFRIAVIMHDRSRINNNNLGLFRFSGPPGQSRLAAGGFALSWRHFRRQRRPALQPAQSPERHRRRILFPSFYVCHKGRNVCLNGGHIFYFCESIRWVAPMSDAMAIGA